MEESLLLGADSSQWSAGVCSEQCASVAGMRGTCDLMIYLDLEKALAGSKLCSWSTCSLTHYYAKTVTMT